MFRLFSKFFFLRLLGWKIEGKFPKLQKYVVAVVPHTSWIDFFVGLMVRSISGEQIKFVGKKKSKHFSKKKSTKVQNKQKKVEKIEKSKTFPEKRRAKNFEKFPK